MSGTGDLLRTYLMLWGGLFVGPICGLRSLTRSSTLDAREMVIPGERLCSHRGGGGSSGHTHNAVGTPIMQWDSYPHLGTNHCRYWPKVCFMEGVRGELCRLWWSRHGIQDQEAWVLVTG